MGKTIVKYNVRAEEIAAPSANESRSHEEKQFIANEKVWAEYVSRETGVSQNEADHRSIPKQLEYVEWKEI